MQKHHTMLIELVIVLILVGFGLWSLKTSAPTIDNTESSQTTAKNTGSNHVNSIPLASITYAQALQLYKDARIQLDTNCRANPTLSTYKNNTTIMVDNRAAVSRTVKVGSIFSIPAYGFKIVKLTSSDLPANWYVDCDTSQNVATILIQK